MYFTFRAARKDNYKHLVLHAQLCANKNKFEANLAKLKPLFGN